MNMDNGTNRQKTCVNNTTEGKNNINSLTYTKLIIWKLELELISNKYGYGQQGKQTEKRVDNATEWKKDINILMNIN